MQMMRMAVAVAGALLLAAGQAPAGFITEITLGDFSNPKVLDFESASLGSVSGTDSVFTDFGISEVSVDTTDATFDDDYSSNSSGNALWADSGGLTIVEPGDTGLAQTNFVSGSHLDYILEFSELHSRIGFSTVDQAGVSLDIEFWNSGVQVGGTSRSTSGTNVLYLQDNSDVFDEVRLFVQGNSGHGIDNITLESPRTSATTPEPSSLVLMGMGVAGACVFGRRRRKASKA